MLNRVKITCSNITSASLCFQGCGNIRRLGEYVRCQHFKTHGHLPEKMKFCGRKDRGWRLNYVRKENLHINCLLNFLLKLT